MHRELIKLLVIVLAIGGGACSRSHSNGGGTEADGLDPEQWKPTAEAVASAKREGKAPLIVARASQPRASAYDLNPRAATGEVPNQEVDSGTDSGSTGQSAEDDPALGEMVKLPPPPMPKLASGDEADQFGLPEWERMARGELHVKRIRY
jgi:hypothetical protein